VKRKKMKKIAIAFGIIACLAVLSLLLTSASAQDDDKYWLGCPSGDGGDLYGRTPSATSIYYEKDIIGIGYENSRATVATHSWYEGLESSTSSRGSARIYRDYQTFNVKTAPADPLLKIKADTSHIETLHLMTGLLSPSTER
jgi:hypothetical protein